IVGGCFVAYAPGEAGPGHPGDRAWAAAVAWTPGAPTEHRPVDRHLRGAGARGGGTPRRADDVLGQAVVTERVPASYVRGLRARRIRRPRRRLLGLHTYRRPPHRRPRRLAHERPDGGRDGACGVHGGGAHPGATPRSATRGAGGPGPGVPTTLIDRRVPSRPT